MQSIACSGHYFQFWGGEESPSWKLRSHIATTILRVAALKVIAVAASLASVRLGRAWMSSGENSEGVRLFEQGNFDASAEKFREAMQNDPNNPDSYYNLAAYYHRQGMTQQKPVDLAQAESYYRQCLDYNPNHIDCRRAGGAVGRTKPFARGFQHARRLGHTKPDTGMPKIELARLYEEFGDKDTAKQNLTAALSISPNDPRALAALGKLREESGDYSQAMSNYQRSLAAYRYQPELAQRVSALQAAGTTPPAVATASGTQLVAAPSGAIR